MMPGDARVELFLILMPSVMFMFSDKLQTKLRAEGGIRALLGMVRCRHPDVLAQVARGMANFAKCESRASTQGIKSSGVSAHQLNYDYMSLYTCLP